MKFPSANGTCFHATIEASEPVRVHPVRCSNGPCAEMSKALIRECPGRTKLLTELQFLGDRDVPVGVGFVEIIQQATAAADHLEQPAARAVILGVLLQMLSEVVNPLCEQSNLNIGAPGVLFVHPKLFNCFVLNFHTVRIQSKNSN